ncbi:beta-propeller fold lactonase family protein [Burkholderia sp. WSM2232]|uniref:beta-propeller fold lactonase family protein n=1 Tax=Burkholderia sp. WSM2232 TaxID=944436 RepID=UPI0018DE349B
MPVSSETFKGTTSGAEIAVSGDGRFVYAENRAEDSLAVCRVDANSGDLSLVQRVAAGSERPWVSRSIGPVSGCWLRTRAAAM